MTEKQLENFLYSCRKKALSLHFIDPNVMNHLLTIYKPENDTYEMVIAANNKIVKDLNLGVCFTMSCYIKNLLDEMGIEESYLMTSFNSNWPNTVVIYKYQDEFLVCDLAEQVRKYEKITKQVGNLITSSVSSYNNEEINNLINLGQNINCLSKKLTEYFKDYPETTCEVIVHTDNEDMNFNELPKVAINEFLKQKLGYSK